MKKYTFFLPLLLIVPVMAGVLLLKKNHTPDDITQVSDYRDLLAETEKEVWLELERLGISRKECQEKIPSTIQELREATYQEHQENGKREISPAVKKLVYEVFLDFGVDYSVVNLEAFSNPAHIAGSNDITLIINEELLSTLSLEAQKFVLGHEAQHIIYHDDALKCIIQEIIDACTDSAQKLLMKNAFLAFSRFVEQRADILAALHSQLYAQGYIRFMQNRLEIIGDKGGNNSTHPKISERLMVAQNIVNTKSFA